MSKDIKKALEHCIEWNCADCPNREELGSGETVCRGRLLPEVLEYVADLEAKLSEKDQDKISFAIEQLNKVKENIKKVPITDFDLSGNFEKMYKQDAIRQIDNQIKQLKGENQ